MPSSIPCLRFRRRASKTSATRCWQKNISFAYFGDQFNAYLANPYDNYVDPDNTYCNICNFFQYSTSIMTNPAVRQDGAAGHDRSLHARPARRGNLPAVSFVKPDGYLDGHPASSKIDLLEGFVKKIVDMTKSNPKLWANTAIFITMDEGGGYYDFGVRAAARLISATGRASR